MSEYKHEAQACESANAYSFTYLRCALVYARLPLALHCSDIVLRNGPVAFSVSSSDHWRCFFVGDDLFCFRIEFKRASELC